MAAQRLQFIDINDCVTAYMNEAELSVHKMFKLTQIAFRAADELGLDFFRQIKSVKLPVSANMTVTLPEDYLNFVKIGILNGRGEVIPLNLNNKLTTYSDLLPNRLANTQDDSFINWDSSINGNFFNYNDGLTIGQLYGLPSGTVAGTFKVDEHNGVILLGDNFSESYIILEYLASPDESQTCYVPMQFKEAIICYIAWKDIRSLTSMRRGNLGEKRDRRHEYYNERRLAIARYRPFRTTEAYQLNLENERLTIKA